MTREHTQMKAEVWVAQECTSAIHVHRAALERLNAFATQCTASGAGWRVTMEDDGTERG